MYRIVKGLLIPILFLVVFFLCAYPLYCQNNFVLQHYTNENGLPANGVKGIAIDKNTGYVWIGTDGGVVRFDGEHFQLFRGGDRTIYSLRIIQLGKTSDGHVCYQDELSSIYLIKGGAPELVADSHAILSVLMAANINKDATAIAEQIIKQSPPFIEPGKVVFHGATSNRAFSFVFNHLAYHYSDGSLQEYIGPGKLESVFKLSDKIIFYDANLNFFCFDGKTTRLIPLKSTGLPGDAGLKKGSMRLYWDWGMTEPLVVYGKGIWKLNNAGDTMVAVPVCMECVPDDKFITHIKLWEEENIIFFGSGVNGLFVYKTSPFKTFQSKESNKENPMPEITQIEIADDVIMNGRGESFYEDERKLNKKFRANRFWNIFKSADGSIWYNRADTVYRLDKNDVLVKIPTGEQNGNMAYAEMDNKIYILTEFSIGVINNSRYQSLYHVPVPEPAIQRNGFNGNDLIEWRPGVLGIAGSRLFTFDIGKKQLDTINLPGLQCKVRSFLTYGEYKFIGTYGQGFFGYKNGIVKKMPLDKNQYLLHAHCFMKDGEGFCWISTNHGLFKVSLSALVQAYDNDLPEIYYHYFGKSNGIINTEFNGGCEPCAIKLKSGLFSFPSMNGFVVFNPEKIAAKPPAGKVFIEEIFADTTSLTHDSVSLNSLPYSIENLRFNISIPAWGNPENIYLSYKLIPHSNNKWQPLDIMHNNIISFGGLKPGSYKLLIRVRNGFEPDQFSMTEVHFGILKPWYDTWWFYLLCITGFITLTWGLVKWRTARIEKKKEELQAIVTAQTLEVKVQNKQLQIQLQQLNEQQVKLENNNRVQARLISIVSHDMITPLKFIGFIAKKIKNTSSQSAISYEAVDSIATVAKELESLSVNILNWIRFHHEKTKMRPEKFNLHVLIDESTEIANILANEKGLKIRNDVPDDFEVYQYREAMGVIVYNLVMNAVKYSSYGEIRITVRPDERSFSLKVSDSGKGMPKELIDRFNDQETMVSVGTTKSGRKPRFGYVIIKDLLLLVNGKLKVQNREDGGTQVTVKIEASENVTGFH